MRDSIKTETYFQNILEDNLFDRESALSRLKKYNDDEPIRKCSLTIFFNLLDKIKLSYSTGEAINNLKEIYLEALPFMEKGWHKNDIDFQGYYSVDQYWDILTLLSIGYVLNIEKEQLDKQIALRKVVKAPDFLLDTLCNAIQNKPLPTQKEVMLGNTYSSLWEVLQAPTKEEATKLLHKHLKSDWYKKSQAHSWHGSHNRNSYVGYWSFESAALVKLLGLDDSTFKGLKYYPYDLLHNN